MTTHTSDEIAARANAIMLREQDRCSFEHYVKMALDELNAEDTALCLFGSLSEFPPALPDEDLAMLGSLPVWPTEREVTDECHAVASRLERRGLIKISRQKMDPSAHRPTWFAGRLPSSMVRLSFDATKAEPTP